MNPPTCGLVLAAYRLVAVVSGPGAEARRLIRAALTDDARFGLLEHLTALDAVIVVTEKLARTEPFAGQAARAGRLVWLAPDPLVAAITRAAAVTGPARLAALLARLPTIPLLRAQLRRLPVAADPRQVPLL